MALDGYSRERGPRKFVECAKLAYIGDMNSDMQKTSLEQETLSSQKSSMSLLGLVFIGLVLGSATAASSRLHFSLAIGIVCCHFLVMSLGVLLFAESRPDNRLSRFGIRGMIGLTLAVIGYCSLLRISFGRLRLENLSLVGWIFAVAIGLGMFWLLMVTLADCLSRLVWFCAYLRRRNRIERQR